MVHLAKRGAKAPPKDNSSRNAKVAVALVMLLVGSAIAVYNADTLYLAGKESLTSQLPASLTPNATNSLMLLTTDGNGNPVSDREYTVKVVQGNDTLVEKKGRTDARGFAAPMVPVPPFEGEAQLVVETGDQVLSGVVVPVATSHIFLTTDKPIYQPGQDVHARVLVLRGDHVAEGSKATFEVKTPEGDKVLRRVATLNEFGVASFDYPLSDQLPLGDYELRVMVDGQEAVRTVKVDEYVLPRFEIDVLEMRPWYTLGEEVDGYILAKYFFGQRVPGTAQLTINLFTGTEWRPVDVWQEETLDDGVFEFQKDLGDLDWHIAEEFGYQSPDTVLLEFNFTVTDTGDHTETESFIVTYATQPIVVSALADANVVGRTSTYYVVARFPNGAPVADAGVSYWIDDDEDDRMTASTDDRGIAALEFEYRADDDYIHIRVAKDQYEGAADLELEEATGLKVVPDKSSYDVGETAHLAVFYDGRGSTDLVYYDVVADGFTIETGHLEMEGTRATLDLPVTTDLGRLTSVRVYKVEKNFDIARDVAVIGVRKQGDLDIEIGTDIDDDPGREAYLPQDPVSLEVRVQRNGEGVEAVLGVSIVDNAVFELGSRYTGFEEVLAGLLPQYADPVYQFMGYIFVGDTPLPSQSVNEWRKIEAAPVETTAQAQGEAAADLENKAVLAYWTVLGAMGIIALVALAALGPRTKKARVAAVVTMLVLVSVGAAAIIMVRAPQETDYGEFSDAPVNFEGGRGFEGGMGPPAEDKAEGAGGIIDIPGLQRDEGMDGGAMTQGAGEGQGIKDEYDDAKASIVRQFFPETWTWIPIMPTDDSGHATIDLVAPDSITSWDVSVIASTRDARVGVGHKNVTVFQEFFVEPDLPAKAFLNDTFPLKVQVYNYGEATDVTVTLTEADWYQVLGPMMETVPLDSGEVGSVEFTVRLDKVGVHEITVTGESATFIDKVVRPLRVKPVGDRVTDLFQGRLAPGDDLSYDLELLPQLIENSENAWVKLQGGVEAAVLEGAENYIHYVSGCGEQSLSTLSIDVLAFRTVREGELDEARLLEFETIVTQGINHELQYLLPAKNGVGRGIVWFPGDRDVHPWLTSWGVITFKDAQTAGFTVDQAIITDMQDWLLTQQRESGAWEFPEWGIYEFNNPKLRQKKLATTAYVTHSLLYSGIPASHEAIGKAVSFIKGEVRDEDNWEDPYVLALSLKVLASVGEARSNLADDIADQLHDLRQEDNGTVYWGTTTNMISNDFFGPGIGLDMMWSRNPGFVIEATGYAAQALFTAGKHSGDVDGALKYLLDHRSSLGGFFSTQDTVVAFQTIYEVSTKQVPVDMEVEVLVDGEQVWTLDMDESNRDLTYLFDLRPHLAEDTTSVRLVGSGEGFVMYQVFLEQWVPKEELPPTLPIWLDLEWSDETPEVDDVVHVEATVTNSQETPVKMALVELVAPVGTEFDPYVLEDLRTSGVVDNVEFEDDDVVRLYINDLEQDEPVTFSYQLRAVQEAHVTAAGNRVWDMYNVLVEMEVPPLMLEIGPA